MLSRQRNRRKADSQCQSRVRQLLARVLDRAEIEIVLRVIAAERKGESFRAGRLGLAENLVRRGWLARSADGSIHVSDETRALLHEAERGR
jgi:hypothetical protein